MSVAEMAEVICGDATDVHANFARNNWRKQFFLLRHRIVNHQIHVWSCSGSFLRCLHCEFRETLNLKPDLEITHRKDETLNECG